MAKINSIFGVYADAKNLTAMINTSLDRFNKPWFQQYFGWGPQQLSLKYSTIVGRSRIEAAASVVDTDSSAPLRSRNNLEKYDGEVASIKEKLKMTQNNYRDFLTLQQLPLSDNVKQQQLLNLLFNDVLIVGNAAMRRLDIMTLQALSTGIISINLANNPDGVVADDIDLFMPAANVLGVVKVWSDPTCDPITDIDAVVEAGRSRGLVFKKALISKKNWLGFKKNANVINSLKGYFNPGSNAKYAMTLDIVNGFLESNGYPYLEVIDEVVGVEKDGVIATIRPFKDENISFIPDGQLGIIHNALAIEQIRPVGEVNYATYQRALISKWAENDPFAEYTGVELNAFPGVETIDSIFILKTDTLSA